ncbi:hypothetical protein HanIR_Chr14g0683551 [Helianthus annuus]|nr:hypothetical protein HanIR_Chr14g0683551 [Helianthus annuus]
MKKTKKMTPAKAKQPKSIRSPAAKRSPASNQVTEQKTNTPCQAKLLSACTSSPPYNLNSLF